jgi:hypothetical protein
MYKITDMEGHKNNCIFLPSEGRDLLGRIRVMTGHADCVISSLSDVTIVYLILSHLIEWILEILGQRDWKVGGRS